MERCSGGDGACRPGGCACAAVAVPAVFVRVTIGQVPRDTSPAAGQVVKLDAETARRLLASGQASPVSGQARASDAG